MLITTQNHSSVPNNINIKPGSVVGILQRYEIQQLPVCCANFETESNCCSTSQQLEIISDSDTNLTRCPCCRCSQVNLICVNCLNTNVVRIGKVRDDKRRLLMSKNAICHLLQNALADEIKFESDFHQIRRSIEEIRAKIAFKREQVGRLRQRISHTASQSERNRQNVLLLEKKMVSHSERINRTNLKKIEQHNLLMTTNLKLNSQIVHIVRFLFRVLRLEKRPVGKVEQIPAWTGQPKPRRFVHTLNLYPCLDRAQLLAKVSSSANSQSTISGLVHSASSQRRQFPSESIAALFYGSQLVELLAQLLHFSLPYPNIHHSIALTALSSSESALRQHLFRLDYAVLHLCLAHGVQPEECELTEPLANLYALVGLISKEKILRCVPRLDQRLHQQICTNFGTIQPDGRVLSVFTLDSVENDWVKVHCSG
uniref:Autophagy-related protein 14 n=1 Tax=Globodera pallida TaxID=36090 RepID=A0A183C9A9_GLOPA